MKKQIVLPPVLRQRERDRGNRRPGCAKASLQYRSPKDGYELTVDTHSMTADACAGQIHAKLFGEENCN